MSFLGGLGKVLGGVGKVASFIPGVGNIAGAALGGLGALASGEGIKGALASAAMNAIPGGGAVKGAGGLLKTIGGAALKAAPGILGSISAAQGAKQQGQANKLNQQALALRQQQYADFAPIRALGIQGLQNTQRPDLTAIYQNKQNPFA